MKRSRRRLLLLGLVVLAAAALVWGASRYTHSADFAGRVADRLETTFGGPVRLAEVDLGLGSTTLRGLDVYEAAAEGGTSEPWLHVDRVDADVSAWQLVRGGTPRRLDLQGAVLTLRFDEDGNLLTRLPKGEGAGGPLPELRVKDGRVVLRQDGRRDMVVRGADAELKPDGDRLVLTGTVRDPYWGDWSAGGAVNRKEGKGSFTLETKRAHVTQDKLETIAFVPPGVWREVNQVEGDSPVTVTFRFGDGGFHYGVKLDPEGAKVRVTAVGLTAEGVGGRIEIDDERVRLVGMSGAAAGGRLKLDSDMDFGGPRQVLKFQVAAEGLDLQSLPADWPVPRTFLNSELSGRVSGSGAFTVTVADDGVTTTGEASARIPEPRLDGQAQPIAKALTFRVRADGTKFSYTSPTHVARDDPEGPLAAVAVPARAPEPDPDLVRGLLDLSGKAADWVGKGVTRGAAALADAGTRVMARLPKPLVGPPDPRKANLLEANFGLEDVDLAQLVGVLRLDLPFPVSGRLTFDVRAAVPVDKPADLKAYRFRGTASLSRLTLAELEFEDVRARVVYADGVLQLEELRARVPAGRQPHVGPPAVGDLSGSARVEVVPQGDFTGRLSLERLPLARILTLVPGATDLAAGALSGQAEVRVPLKRLQDPAAWSASGTVSSPRLQAYGWGLTDVAANVRVERGVLSVPRALGNLEGAPVSASGELNLSGPFRYRAKADLKPLDLAAVQRLAPDFRPPVTVTGRFRGDADLDGTLSPFKLGVSGSGEGTDLTVEGVKLAAVNFKWSTDGDRLKLNDVRTRLYKGEITGSAVIPLKEAEAGRVDVRFQDVDAAALLKDVPASPIGVEGRVAGTVEGTLSPAKPAREFAAKLELRAPRLRVQGIPAEKLSGTVDVRKGGVDYRFIGETLGGRFNLNGKVPADQPKPDEPPPEGRLRVDGARLSRLGEALGMGEALRPLRGVIDLDVTFRHEGPAKAPVGRGRFTLTRLRWDDRELFGDVRGDVRLTGRELRLSELSGSLGEGLLRAQVALNLRQSERSWFTLNLDRVDAGRLLAPWPEVADLISGPVDVRLRGNLGPQWSGDGQVVLSRGKVIGLEVNEWRLPVHFTFVPGQGSGELDVRDSNAQIAQGRAVGSASLRWGGSAHLEGQVRFFGVEVQPVVRQFASTSLGTGQLTGRIDFAGREMRSLNDLTATVQADLKQARALELPVLRSVVPLVAPGQASTLFRTGELEARLANGVVRVQRLSLVGDLVKLLVEGTVSLEGRLNLEATARTGGTFPNLIALRAIARQIPAIGPVPVGLIARATELLANRVIYLTITGTVRQPTVRLQPIKTLSEEAVRFFLLRALE